MEEIGKDKTEFDILNDTVKTEEQFVDVKLRLKVYGNREQMQKTLARLKFEIELQGFDVVYLEEDDEGSKDND